MEPKTENQSCTNEFVCKTNHKSGTTKDSTLDEAARKVVSAGKRTENSISIRPVHD